MFDHATPTDPERLSRPASEKIAHITHHFHEILLHLGLDMNDPSLAKTPERIARMYVNEVFSGLDPAALPSIHCMDNTLPHNQHHELVFSRIHFHSFCEHHFVPMNGTASVAYVPRDKLIGLSKIPRLVRYFARRPQLQERLTHQIADALSHLLDTPDVAVSLSAQHFCVQARGIEDENGHTVTTTLRGNFQADPALRQQFFEAINRLT